jgi:hypothetical protein
MLRPVRQTSGPVPPILVGVDGVARCGAAPDVPSRGKDRLFRSIDAMKALRLLSTAEYAAGDPGGMRVGSPQRGGASWSTSRSMPTSAIPRCRWRPRTGNAGTEGRIVHARGALRQFLVPCERGSPVALETVGTWDLERGRDRSGRPGPAAGPRPQGKAHARHGEQARYARRAGAEPAPADRDAPHRVDPARCPPRPAGSPPHPQGPDPGAHPPQAPDPRHPGQGLGCGSRGRAICSGAAGADGSRPCCPCCPRIAGTRRSACWSSWRS